MILLFGATGYVGQAFAEELHRRRLAFVPLCRQTMDCSDFGRLLEFLRQLNPSFVINSAGFVGKMDARESGECRSLAIEANAVFPQILGRACALTNTPMGHVSSSAIYTGGTLVGRKQIRIVKDISRPLVQQLLKRRPDLLHGFTEVHEPNRTFRSPPCSHYAGAKALAEEFLSDWRTVYIWRPGVLFDEVEHPRNFLCGFHCSPEAADSPNSFSHRGDFVRACLDLWERNAPFGTYNVVNDGPLTPRTILRTVRRLFKPKSHKGLLDGRHCPNVSEAILPQAKGCVLDSAKLSYSGVKMRTAFRALEDSLRMWHSNRTESVRDRTSVISKQIDWTRQLIGLGTPEA